MKLNINRKIRRYSALAAVMLGISASLVSTSAQGTRSTYYFIDYYSDDTYTNLVGQKMCGCVSCSSWGIVTPYYEKDEGTCGP